ncbi:hypothetical protein ALI22I_04625 [Saccharothrix sp. ALI-22-I]|nr:hypothetical protein ALI22I_04625 [Saccharothrix sp. ALI-22-I]
MKRSGTSEPPPQPARFIDHQAQRPPRRRRGRQPAHTPQETAVSITAEIVAHANRGTGLPLSRRTGPIHRPAAHSAT